MSTDVNTRLLERAAAQIDYWEGTMHARIIQRDIEANDLEALRYHVQDAEAHQAIQEDNAPPEAPDKPKPHVFDIILGPHEVLGDKDVF